MTEKETGNAQTGACVDVLPRCSSTGNSFCNGYTDREESENKKRKKKGCLPNIEECRPRSSLVWTRDRTRGSLEVFAGADYLIGSWFPGFR